MKELDRFKTKKDTARQTKKIQEKEKRDQEIRRPFIRKKRTEVRDRETSLFSFLFLEKQVATQLNFPMKEERFSLRLRWTEKSIYRNISISIYGTTSTLCFYVSLFVFFVHGLSPPYTRRDTRRRHRKETRSELLVSLQLGPVSRQLSYTHQKETGRSIHTRRHQQGDP